MNRKTIAVMGATGAQGGSLARAILDDRPREFAVRALTRHPESPKARALADLGAEVVKADMDDPRSLADAFQGAYGVFCVTPFWEHMSPERELAQARSMAQASREARVKHAIWSTLEDTRLWVPLEDPRMPTLKEHYKVPHLDAKGEANRFFLEYGVPTTFLHTSFYWDNLVNFGMTPKAGADGRLHFVLPMGDKKLPGIAAEDIGRCALGVFKNPDRYIGRSVGIAGEHLTGAQMAARLKEALGRDVVHDAVSPEQFRSFGFPGADDLGNMFQFKAEFESDYCGARNLRESKALNPRLQTFAEWLDTHKDLMPIG